jgi:membrane-associated protein
MNFEHLLTDGLQLVSGFTPKIAIFIFLVCFIGEGFIISIPLVFETVWLAAGYQLSAGVLPVPDLILLMLMGQLGRQAGAFVLYSLSRSGTRFFQRFIARRIPRKDSEEDSPLKILRHIDSISPFGVALGRLMWLRIPLTVLLGARRRFKPLMLGILISGTIYECVYIGLGAVVGSTAKPKTPYVILYFAAGLTAFYAVAFGVRMLIKTLRHRRPPNVPPGQTPG